MRIVSSITLIICALSVFLNTSCKKNTFFSNGNLEFSRDTVLFDTVFTTIGSTTALFKVYNTDNRDLKIEEIQLMGGSASPFRFNFDGENGTYLSDIEIIGKDSLFGFVEVTVDPNGGTLPLIIEDSIRFRTNGTDQYIKLAVWGQDAYFHYNDTVSGIWPNDKPHVIYNSTRVVDGSSLTIQAGTDIYLHNQSLMYIKGSSLNVTGTTSDKVTFQGDRLESFYDDVSGQYYGIYFEEALPSTIDNAIIKNGTAGLHVFSQDPSNGTTPTVTITNSEISNHASYGLFSYSGANVKAENTLFSNNGFYSFFLLEGGDYDFSHCHFLSYGGEGTNPAVAIKNYFTRSDNITYVGDIETGNMTNCLIYGGIENELIYDTINPDGTLLLNYQYTNCLIKKATAGTGPGFVGNFYNTNPGFVSIEDRDFHSAASSILKDNGVTGTGVFLDLDGNTRDASPDIGCYEIQ